MHIHRERKEGEERREGSYRIGIERGKVKSLRKIKGTEERV